jgi:hypothetical protein
VDKQASNTAMHKDGPGRLVEAWACMDAMLLSSVGTVKAFVDNGQTARHPCGALIPCRSTHWVQGCNAPFSGAPRR